MKIKNKKKSQSRKQPEQIKLWCLNCRKELFYDVDSPTGRGIFNAFCGGFCEDEYAWRE